MRQQEAFAGVEIITDCIMSNHVHLLVRVPFVRDEDVSDETILKRAVGRYGDSVQWVNDTKQQMAEGNPDVNLRV